jgi:hypothetical protein
MEELNTTTDELKQRHGCVTAWLILIIVINTITALIYLFAGDTIASKLPGEVSPFMLSLLGILGVANVVSAILLFKWKKYGFWGFVTTSVGTLIINLMIGIGIGQSLFGLIGIGVLYGVLQIKKGDISAWENLE